MRQLKIKIENLVFMHAGHDDSADPTKALLAQNMPLLLNTAWSLSVLDIESSVSSPPKHFKQRKGSKYVAIECSSCFCASNALYHFSLTPPRCQVSRATKYVTRDVGVPWQTRFKRARALLLLGKVCTPQHGSNAPAPPHPAQTLQLIFFCFKFATHARIWSRIAFHFCFFSLFDVYFIPFFIQVFTEVGAAHGSSSSEGDAGMDSIAAMKKVGVAAVLWPHSLLLLLLVKFCDLFF